MKRTIFEFFNKGGGWKLAAAAVDLKFLLWKAQHSDANLSDYYAISIATGLKHGRTHKTLGSKKFLSGSLASSPAELDQLEILARGTNYFETAIKYGFQPEHMCIDYGCGSLRVGQHLIGYLQPERYWGLDVVSDFYETGKTLLPSHVLKMKKPRFHIINPLTIKTVSMQKPHFIFSFAVLKHIPPDELDAYFGKIVSMMGSYSRVVITFNQAKCTARSGAKIWDYCQDDILTSAYSQRAGLNCTINPFCAEDVEGLLPRVSILLISSKSKWNV